MKKRIMLFIIFFLFVLSCSLNAKSMASMDCQQLQNSDVIYANATFTDFNYEEYNEYQRGISTEEYYSKSWDDRYIIDENAMLFGSIDAKCEGGKQNGYVNSNVYGSYFGTVQGLAKDKLVDGNLCIVDNYTNGTSFFPNSNNNQHIYKEVLSNWRFPFMKEDNGYYTFNSDKYHVYKNYNSKTFELHEGKKSGFFPFNNCEDDTFVKTNRNLAFSAKIEIPFTMTYDGRIINKETNEKEDMTFNFSGDDDVWVYVDDKLVLDLGGCHGKTSGSINFAQNQVYYEKIYHIEQDQNEFDVYKTAFENGLLSQGEHVLRVFYIERSGGDANLSISFNLLSGSVKTEHIDIDTNKVLDEETQNGPVGRIVTTKAKNLEGYTLVQKPDIETFKISNEKQTAKYYYAKKTTVIAKYIDEVTNEEISSMVVINGKSGDEYVTTQKEINNYDFTKVEGLPSGTMKGEIINVIYYYKHKAKITVNYIDKDTGRLLGKEEVFSHEGDIFNPELRHYEDYQILEKPKEESINVYRDNIILNYYYQRLQSNLQIEMNLSKAYINGNYFELDNKIGKIETEIRDAHKNSLAKIYYTLKVTNDGQKRVSGYITVTIPDGFSIENTNWVVNGNLAKYRVVDLDIGETREYQIILRKNKGVDIAGDFKLYAKIDSEKLQETTYEDNEDMNELAIMPKTGGQALNVGPIILTLIVIAISIVIKINCNRNKKNKKVT